MDEDQFQTTEEELVIPRAAINKMIKLSMPQMRVSHEVREALGQFALEFIHHVAEHSNDICANQSKKVIGSEHVLEALCRLGFGEYTTHCKDVIDEGKEYAAKKRKASHRLEDLGIPEDELLRQQQELFAKARQEQEAIERTEWELIQSRLQQQNSCFENTSGNDDEFD